MPPRRILLLLAVVALAIVAVMYIKKQLANRQATPEEPREGAFVLVCPSFGNGNSIPADYTAGGQNISPALTWENVPEGTRTFALIVEDPDAPTRTFTHWIVCEIPGNVRELRENVPHGEQVAGLGSGVQGNNDFHELGYGGPNPPAGKEHRYYFRLYALDTTLEMVGSYSKNQLRTAMRGHILGEATLMGRYKHPEETPEAQAP